jgi:hypothetical protein
MSETLKNFEQLPVIPKGEQLVPDDFEMRPATEQTFEEMDREAVQGLRPEENLQPGQFTMREVAQLNASGQLRVSIIEKSRDDGSKHNIHVVDGVGQETPVEEIIKKLDLPQFEIAVFVMGGAGKTDDEVNQKLMAVLPQALAQAAKERKLLVGDGGTQSGVMIATGEGRKRAIEAQYDFVLLGVAPKEELSEFYPDQEGKYPIEPNHTHAVAVASKPEDVGEYGAWGNETRKMYELFGKLSEGKPGIGIVVNGGGITVNEVIQNMKQGRRLIVLENTGRAADGLAAIKRKFSPELLQCSQEQQKTSEEEEEEEEFAALKQALLSQLPDESEERKRAQAFIDAAENIKTLQSWIDLLIVEDIDDPQVVENIAGHMKNLHI